MVHSSDFGAQLNLLWIYTRLFICLQIGPVSLSDPAYAQLCHDKRAQGLPVSVPPSEGSWQDQISQFQAQYCSKIDHR